MKRFNHSALKTQARWEQNTNRSIDRKWMKKEEEISTATSTSSLVSVSRPMPRVEVLYMRQMRKKQQHFLSGMVRSIKIGVRESGVGRRKAFTLKIYTMGWWATPVWLFPPSSATMGTAKVPVHTTTSKQRRVVGKRSDSELRDGATFTLRSPREDETRFSSSCKNVVFYTNTRIKSTEVFHFILCGRSQWLFIDSAFGATLLPLCVLRFVFRMQAQEL